MEFNHQSLEKAGRLIKTKREELGLTQDGLAKKLFVTPQAVSLWENGARFPGPGPMVKLFEILDLNPVELISGREMFDDDLKKKIAHYMSKMNEEVFVAGKGRDRDGNEIYIDLSNCEVVTTDENGDSSGKWIPYTRYYNVVAPDKSDAPAELEKEVYDPTKIYLNCGAALFVIPIEMLNALGRPKFISLYRTRNEMDLILRPSNDEGTFDIPEKLYSGNYMGLKILGGEFGDEVYRSMRIRYMIDKVAITPDIKDGCIFVHLDEAEIVNVSIDHSKFLLPGWQYEEYWAEDDEWDEDDENDESDEDDE